jgi:hypothetical protein
MINRIQSKIKIMIEKLYKIQTMKRTKIIINVKIKKIFLLLSYFFFF